MLVSRHFQLRRLKMLGLLDELEAAGGKAKSIYVPPGLSLPEVESLLHVVLEAEPIPPNLAELAASSETGAVLFWGSSRKCLVLPPFPIKEERSVRGYDIEPLLSLLHHDFRIALFQALLVHAANAGGAASKVDLTRAYRRHTCCPVQQNQTCYTVNVW